MDNDDIISNIVIHCSLMDDYLNLLQLNSQFYRVITRKQVYLEWKRLHTDRKIYDDIAFDDACKWGCLEVAKQLLIIDHVNIYKESEKAFSLACKKGHIHVTEWLLEMDPDLCIDEEILVGSLAMMEWLDQKGLVTDAVIKNYIYYIWHGPAEIAYWLYEKGHIEFTAYCLLQAISSDNVELCEFIYPKIKERSDIFKRVENHVSCSIPMIEWVIKTMKRDYPERQLKIHKSHEFVYESVFETLFGYNDDLFVEACFMRNVEIVEYLYNLSCDNPVNIHAGYFMKALIGDNYEIAKWLYEHRNFELDEILIKDIRNMNVSDSVEAVKWIYFDVLNNEDYFIEDIGEIFKSSISTNIWRHGKGIYKTFNISVAEWIVQEYPHLMHSINIHEKDDALFLDICMGSNNIFLAKCVVDICEKFNLGPVNIHARDDHIIKHGRDTDIDDFLIELSKDPIYGKFNFDFDDDAMMRSWFDYSLKFTKMYRLCQQPGYEPIPREIISKYYSFPYYVKY